MYTSQRKGFEASVPINKIYVLFLSNVHTFALQKPNIITNKSSVSTKTSLGCLSDKLMKMNINVPKVEYLRMLRLLYQTLLPKFHDNSDAENLSSKAFYFSGKDVVEHCQAQD